VRYAYAITGALLLSGAAAAMTLAAAFGPDRPERALAQIAVAPQGGAPMSFADMVAKLQPAVVNISTTQRVQVQPPANPFAGTPFGDLFGQFNGGAGRHGAVTTASRSRARRSRSARASSSRRRLCRDQQPCDRGRTKGATVESIKVT
jgi:serine protease Do